ncbi:MAG: UTP--glucose-1-phosphate uridylyltransferase, partial [Patescibacteria group bacterium]|nr:UTP--glucose-1-phosphate uridylyltransferase [Patescibacteria group bacterium]
GDDIINSGKPAIGQLMEIFAKYGDPVVATERVPRQNVSKYGIVGSVQLDEKTWEIKSFIEKPSAEEAPSDLAAVGRYIITPEIINILKNQKPGKDGEIRLAGAFSSRLSAGRPVYGCQFEGKRYDCGDKLQFVIAQIETGLEHPEMNEGLKKYLERFNG